MAFTGIGLAVDKAGAPACEDKIAAEAVVVPRLDSPLFHKTESSFKWHIVESESGGVEDTTDGKIDADDLLRLEHTANCTSTHQGEHAMEFCEAMRDGENILLSLDGGMPAYASSLRITLEPSLAFHCAFQAVYPSPTPALRWKITQKKLRLKSRDIKAGHRLHGWISVTFEESDGSANPPRRYKIEGYIKPVIQHARL